jgi:hypothetical protein
MKLDPFFNEIKKTKRKKKLKKRKEGESEKNA